MPWSYATQKKAYNIWTNGWEQNNNNNNSNYEQTTASELNKK